MHSDSSNFNSCHCLLVYCLLRGRGRRRGRRRRRRRRRRANACAGALVLCWCSGALSPIFWVRFFNRQTDTRSAPGGGAILMSAPPTCQVCGRPKYFHTASLATPSNVLISVVAIFMARSSPAPRGWPQMQTGDEQQRMGLPNSKLSLPDAGRVPENINGRHSQL